VIINLFCRVRDNPRSVLQRIYQFLDLSNGYLPDDYKAEKPTPIITKFEKNLRILKLYLLVNYMPKSLKKIGKKTVIEDVSPEKTHID